MNNDIEKLLDAIKTIVNDKNGGSWQEKKAKIETECDEDQRIALGEFVAWFD